jgi:HEPN domain-containing protein
MKPHIEEAWHALRLADRDIKVLEILTQEPGVHISMVCFHAQQAVEKSLKAVLFSRQIEFRRTHTIWPSWHAYCAKTESKPRSATINCCA